MDRAGAEYWDDTWNRAALGHASDPADRRLRNYVVRRLHRLFRKHLATLPGGSSIVEVGCANSSWLPYFSKQFHFRIGGLDYSAVGCAKTVDVLERENTPGEIVQADLFDPPTNFVNRFDAAESQGLVEHFEDTAHPVSAIARLVRPEGTIVTVIPNLVGILGPLQRFINRAVYDVHVPLTREQLSAAHERAGLEVIDAGYLVPLNFGICNLSGMRGVSYMFARIFIAVLVRVAYVVWIIDERVRLPETRAFSGSVYCVARKR